MTIKVCDCCRKEVSCSESATEEVVVGEKTAYFKMMVKPTAEDTHVCKACFMHLLRLAYEKTCDEFGLPGAGALA